MMPKAVLTLLSLAVSFPLQGSTKKEPTLAEILSAKPLNGLLADTNAAHAKGRRGPNVPLDPALADQINVAPPGGGNFALLRKGKLTWSAAFDREKLRGTREVANGLALEAVRSLKQGVEKGTLD